MKSQTFTSESLKAASDAAAVYIRGLQQAGYVTALFGLPQPGQFILSVVDSGWRVVVNPLPGRALAV